MHIVFSCALLQLAVPQPRGYVNDFAGVLDAASVAHMDSVIAEVRDKTRGEIAVVTLSAIGDRAAADVALQIGRQWGVGAKGEAGDRAKNLGVVVLLVPLKNHRTGTGQLFIATGRGAEGFLPDVRVGRIRDAMTPLLAREEYGAGLARGVDLLAQGFAQEFGVTLTGVPPPRGDVPIPISWIVVAVIVLLIATRGRILLLPLWFGGFGGRRGGWSGGGSWGAAREDASRMASTLTVEHLADAVGRAIGERLVALLLYGSTARGTHVPQRSDVNTLLICDAVDERLFEALAPSIRDWTRAGHPAPLIFTEREWRESATAFPIEYEEVREAHRLLAGKDPWQGITVRREDLRHQLEHELMGKLVRLRQAYGTLWGDPKRLGSVIRGSAPGFLTMLRTVLRFSGKPVPVRPAELLSAAAAVIGFSTDGLGPLVRDVEGGPALRLGRGDPLVPAYLAALARTAQYVTQLR